MQLLFCAFDNSAEAFAQPDSFVGAFPRQWGETLHPRCLHFLLTFSVNFAFRPLTFHKILTVLFFALVKA